MNSGLQCCHRTTWRRPPGRWGCCSCALPSAHLPCPTRIKSSAAFSLHWGCPKKPSEGASWPGWMGAWRSSSQACSCFRFCGCPMSVPSSTTSSDMASPGYLRALGLSVAIWLGLFVLFTWTIDPYGVSPLRLSLQGMNAQKPKRIDIDRLIKPYEVWRYQPRTVFLGTSRMHQSMDPSVLDGTRFAPAYNASMPAASMDMHAAYLRQYVQLDKNLRTVIVELFLPNFIGHPPGLNPGTWSEFFGNAVTLFVSFDTLWDSLYTLAYNAVSGRPIHQIERGGHLYFPNRGDPKSSFDAFAPYMWGGKISSPEKA